MTAAAHLAVLAFYVFKMSFVFSLHSPLTDCPTISSAITDHVQRHPSLALCTHPGSLRSLKLSRDKSTPGTCRIATALTLVLILSGDIEQNPGPVNNTYYPCGHCELQVNYGDKALCCDNCDNWYHKSCVNMHSATYSYLQTNIRVLTGSADAVTHGTLPRCTIRTCYQSGTVSVSYTIYKEMNPSVTQHPLLRVAPSVLTAHPGGRTSTLPKQPAPSTQISSPAIRGHLQPPRARTLPHSGNLPYPPSVTIGAH